MAALHVPKGHLTLAPCCSSPRTQSRMYPDMDDSAFFGSFPALFALAFHVVCVDAEQVGSDMPTFSESAISFTVGVKVEFLTRPLCSTTQVDLHLAQSIPTPFSASSPDTSAPNYLRVAHLNDDEGDFGFGESRGEGSAGMLRRQQEGDAELSPASAKHHARQQRLAGESPKCHHAGDGACNSQQR